MLALILRLPITVMLCWTYWTYLLGGGARAGHKRNWLPRSLSSFSCAFCLPIMAGICLRKCPMIRQWILAARTLFTNSFTCTSAEAFSTCQLDACDGMFGLYTCTLLHLLCPPCSPSLVLTCPRTTLGQFITFLSHARWGISYRSCSRSDCSFSKSSTPAGFRSDRTGLSALKDPMYTLHTCKHTQRCIDLLSLETSIVPNALCKWPYMQSILMASCVYCSALSPVCVRAYTCS